MRVYIAASFPRQIEARKLAMKLKEEGFTITSTWIFQTEVNSNEDQGGNAQRFATRDIIGILRAQVFVMLTGDDLSGGGRHTELGIAIERSMPVFLYGPRENVFHHLDGIMQTATYDDLVEALWTIMQSMP